MEERLDLSMTMGIGTYLAEKAVLVFDPKASHACNKEPLSPTD